MSTLVAAPVLKVADGPNAGKIYDVRKALRIGRHPYNEVSLSDASCSRYHCWLTVQDGSLVLEDLASSNGTFVNGDRVMTKRTLKTGDIVRVGTTEFAVTELE